MPRTANEKLLDAWLTHHHFLERFANGLAKQLEDELRKAIEEITGTINHRRALWLQAARPDGRFSFTRLEALFRQVQQILRALEVEQSRELRATLEEAVRAEQTWALRALRSAIPDAVHVSLVGLPVEALREIIGEPSYGIPWAQRLRRHSEQVQFRIRSALTQSLVQGESIDRAQTRLSEVVWPEMERHRVTIARTELLRVSNEANQHVFVQNDDVIKGMKYVATLDLRTCPRCRPLDGKLYLHRNEREFRARPRPPIHPRCRCTYVPVLKSWRELGLDGEDLPAQARASMDGVVPGDLTYPEWLKGKNEDDPASVREMLGPRRYDLWRSGKVKLDEMASQTRIFRLDEIPS